MEQMVIQKPLRQNALNQRQSMANLVMKSSKFCHSSDMSQGSIQWGRGGGLEVSTPTS